ncbi:MAG: hypothetical protein FJ265_08745 [Planctomycetes bacterium]|nr:hypothetical protein [Planctomycetota bacterium]
MLTTTLLVSVLCQGPANLTASVDDPVSHGALGDQRLSLDEAIRLANGTLLLTQLSAAERARVTGTGTVVDTILVDPATVPQISLQQPLTSVTGLGTAGPRLLIRGAAGMGAGMVPVLHAGSQPQALQLRTHLVTVQGLRFAGGQVGVDARMATTGMPVMDMAMVMDCEFEAQTTCGFRLHGTGSDESMLVVVRTSLKNMPAGFLLDDQTAGGSLMGEGEFLTFDGVGVGCDVVENGAGNLTMWMLFRSTFGNGQTLARKRRTATSTQQFMFRLTHCEARCDGDVVDVQGNALGLTMVHHHHSTFVAGATHKALSVWPRTAEFDLHGSEMRFVGDVAVAGNPFTMRVWQQNNLYENGTVTYDVDGALPNLLWNRYTNCTVIVPATARSPVAVRQSEFLDTTVAGQSFFAPIALQGCYRSGGGLSGQASESAPAPARFLGTTTVSPVDPQIGGTVRVSTDLPFGIAAVWDFAISYPRPVTATEPVRFYGDPATVIVLPGMAVFQSNIDVPLPHNPALVGLELYAQAICLPLLGQAYAPVYHLPRGGLIRPRL